MKNRGWLLSILLLASTGCKTGGSSATLEDAAPAVGESAPIHCETGAYTPFSIVSASPRPNPVEFIYEGVQEAYPIGTQSFFVRLDICLDEASETAVLKQIVLRGLSDVSVVVKTNPDGSVEENTLAQETIPIGKGAVVKGVFPALFGDYSALNITVFKQDSPFLVLNGTEDSGLQTNKGFQIKGPPAGENGYLTFARGAAPTPGKFLVRQAVTGSLQVGDQIAQAQGACSGDSNFRTGRVRLGSFTLLTEFCWFGEAVPPLVTKISVKDSDPAAGAKANKETTISDRDAIAKMFKYVTTHHGINDRWTLDSNGVHYHSNVSTFYRTIGSNPETHRDSPSECRHLDCDAD
jgi:hypothetical protein